MAVISKQNPSPAFVHTIDEIMRLYRSLPPRPSIEEIQAACSVVATVKTEEQVKLEEISSQEVPKDVPEEIFSVYQLVRKTMVLFQSLEQSREALQLIEADKLFQTFDELIQRASGLVSGDTQSQKQTGLSDPVEQIGRESRISEQVLVLKKESEESAQSGDLKGLVRSASAKNNFSAVPINEGDTEKLSLMKVAALIENTLKTGGIALDLKGKLMDQVEWLPLSIGKLSEVTELDLSENKITALPASLGSMRALTKLDVHSNQLTNLPDSFGELINLTDLDLHANRFSSLPTSFGNLVKLVNLDLSSNYFTQLPDTIGKLASLKTLNVDTNELEEIPYTIGSCVSLVELRLDFNRLKALPEAVGKLESLEILTLHYNRIKGLPTTMGNLAKLKELDVSFNELEFIPENLCFAVNLEKLNVGKNFADLTALPRSIGNLEKLEELDISDDQIRMLPDSFRFLSKLRVFRAEETPLEVPPRQITKMGAQAVVEFMADLVAQRDNKFPISKKKKKKNEFWVCFARCFCCGASTTAYDQ